MNWLFTSGSQNIGASAKVLPMNIQGYIHIHILFLFLRMYQMLWTSVVAQTVGLQCRRPGFDPWVGKIPWRRAWEPTPVFVPGESHGQRSLVGCSLWDHKELDMTE